MDLVTRTDLEALGAWRGDEQHVSLYLPTHRAGPEARTDPLRWKNLLSETEAALVDGGAASASVRALLAPAWDFYEDALEWQYVGDGLAMFLRPDWHRTLRLPMAVPELAAVGDRFAVGPLLPAVTGDERFFVLCVSQRSVRLLRGSRHRVRDIELYDVPTSLRAAIEEPGPRSETMTRPAVNTRRGGPALFYGTGGGADDDFRADEIDRYLREVESGLHDLLAGRTIPMVLVGLDDLLALYRHVATYPHVLPTAVRQNPDQLSAEQLHAAAWPIVAAEHEQRMRAALDRFHTLLGTGQASYDERTVQDAAEQARIDTLFLAADRRGWQQDDRESPVVVLGSNGGLSQVELLDRVATATLTTGGQAYVVPRESMPGEGDVAATFRY